MEKVTEVYPIILGLTLFMGLLMIVLPRKFVIIPMILTALYCTIAQRIVIFEFNFYMLRILMLFGLIRVTLKEGISSISLNSIDKTIILWLIVNVVIGALRSQTLFPPLSRLGLIYDVTGYYFLFRFLIKDINDINRVFKMIAISIVPVACIMLFEYKTGRNIFAVFGGVPEFSELRNGVARCQGPFRHQILAGTFAATLVPLFVSFWWKNQSGKIFACVGIIAATSIVVTSHSSGPLMASFFAIVGLSMWLLRNNMKTVRWSIFFSLIALHFVMKAPVWYILDRISGLIGGGGWHRAYLIDQAMKHLNEWWLIGTEHTGHWMPTSLGINTDSADITNYFIGLGITGGLATMILFILILVRCYQGLGNRLQSMNDSEFPAKFTMWAMGTALFAHIVSFFSVSYFDQINMFWYLLLACISTISIFPQNKELLENKQAILV